MDSGVEEELWLIKSYLEVLRVAFADLAEHVSVLNASVLALHGQYEALGRSFGGEDASVEEGEE